MKLLDHQLRRQGRRTAERVVNYNDVFDVKNENSAVLEKKWMNGWAAAATFEGEFSNVTASYAGKGVVRYQW